MASCADDLGAPHERVLESADLPLTSILAQLELRVVAAVARVCKLWHELSSPLGKKEVVCNALVYV